MLTHRAIVVMVLWLACVPVAWGKLTDLPAGSDAQRAAIKCVRTIQKEGARYAAAHVKLLVKCKAAVIKGQGGALAACDPLSGAAATKDAANAQKLADKIARRCGGRDRLCGAGTGVDADVPLADINWDVGDCRPLEKNDPGFAIGDCGDIADCIVSHARASNHRVANDLAADQFDAALFGAGAEPDKTSNKCQSAAFKALTKFYLLKSKTLLKCWSAKAKRKGDDFDDADPCPDTDPQGRATAAIEKAERKLAATLCKACGGGGDDDKDGTCDVPGAVVAPGFVDAPFWCPPVVVAGSSVAHFYDTDADPATAIDCEAMGDPLVDTIQEYVDCLACVAEYHADCVALANNGENPDHGMIYPNTCDTSLCGNGVIDPNEACDPGMPPPQCPNAGNGLQGCTEACRCVCPRFATFEPDATDPGSRIDVGFTGFGHDTPVLGDALVTVSLEGGTSGVPGLRDPNCGVMTVGGPVENPLAGAGQLAARRCSVDHSIRCEVDSDCPPSETCLFYFGARLPYSSGGVSSCVTTRFVEPIVGTANVETGESATQVALTSEVVIGVAVDRPCENCLGDLVANDGSPDGSCDRGFRMGEPCDVGGVSPIPAFNGSPQGNPSGFCTGPGLPRACCSGAGTGSCLNGTSLDCPSAPLGQNVAVFPVDFSNSTGVEGLTVQATGPGCTAGGFGGFTCLCDTCAHPDADVCNADSDCPAGATCGGLRCLEDLTGGGVPCSIPGIGDPACHTHCTGPGAPEACCTGPGMGACTPCGTTGEPTKPNNCSDAVCTDGDCLAGPFPGFCGPTETFRGCLVPLDCPHPGDTCVFSFQPCFPDNGVVGGMVTAVGSADVPVNDTARPTVATTFCLRPAAAASINSASGLPGVGRVTLTGNAFGLP